MSGEYWFDSVIPGKTILVPCDMQTEGDLSFPFQFSRELFVHPITLQVSGLHLIKLNILLRSLIVRKKPWDGRLIVKTPFLDADECSASLRVCDVNATCQNTPRSYLCVCDAGLTGDGKTCTGNVFIIFCT